MAGKRKGPYNVTRTNKPDAYHGEKVRKCLKCKKPKSVETEFYRRPDGTPKNWCKQCTLEYKAQKENGCHETYIPTVHDNDRMKRMANVSGRFVNCRFYKDAGGSVDCEKHGVRQDCKSCYTCPNCAGTLRYERTVIPDYPVTYIDHAKVCMQCSAYYAGEREAVPNKPEHNIGKNDGVPHCSVEGCQHRTWDYKRYENLLVCNSHSRQVKTWQKLFRNGEKSEAERPLILEGGRLVENPFYNKKVKKPGVK